MQENPRQIQIETVDGFQAVTNISGNFGKFLAIFNFQKFTTYTQTIGRMLWNIS